MKREEISREKVEDRLSEHEQNGLHVDSRLWREISEPGWLFLVTLETEDEFLSLVWQAIDDTRPLAPQGRPRSLKDCVLRLESFGGTFGTLIAGGFPWFQKCVEIDIGFDYEKVGWIAVTPLLAGERQETPNGRYYIL